jgi:hypothetical protein
VIDREARHLSAIVRFAPRHEIEAIFMGSLLSISTLTRLVKIKCFLVENGKIPTPLKMQCRSGILMNGRGIIRRRLE